ncbi:MAG TPA: hypothetical protein H9851_04770 [Candidatus Borkfalkia faecavium]|uniref:Uncharacterized protein n=1 Tax=Candidatus Borkfalkia faecavium TaxID=2838508 RepID=A0A9D2AUN8_9FIRM|nr:hypothetical protein [Candidatus Borkfalkia faecavium]
MKRLPPCGGKGAFLPRNIFWRALNVCRPAAGKGRYCPFFCDLRPFCREIGCRGERTLQIPLFFCKNTDAHSVYMPQLAKKRKIWYTDTIKIRGGVRPNV